MKRTWCKYFVNDTTADLTSLLEVVSTTLECRITCERTESDWEWTLVLHKSDQQQQFFIRFFIASCVELNVSKVSLTPWIHQHTLSVLHTGHGRNTYHPILSPVFLWLIFSSVYLCGDFEGTFDDAVQHSRKVDLAVLTHYTWSSLVRLASRFCLTPRKRCSKQQNFNKTFFIRTEASFITHTHTHVLTHLHTHTFFGRFSPKVSAVSLLESGE